MATTMLLAIGCSTAGAATIKKVRDLPGYKNPQGIAIDQQGRIFVADAALGTVIEKDAHGNLVRAFSGHNTLVNPTDVALSGSNLFVADHGSDQIVKIRLSDDSVLGSKQGPLAPGVASLFSVAVDQMGNLYAADQDGKVARTPLSSFPSGSWTDITPVGANQPQFIRSIPSRGLFLGDSGNDRILGSADHGNSWPMTFCAGSGTMPNQCHFPGGMAPFKYNGTTGLLFNDFYNNRLNFWSFGGTFITNFTSPDLPGGPAALAVGPCNHIFDDFFGNNFVREFALPADVAKTPPSCGRPHLALTKRAVDENGKVLSAKAAIGTFVTYQIRVTNDGQAAAKHVHVVDLPHLRGGASRGQLIDLERELPPYCALGTVKAGFNSDSHMLSCSIGTLRPGQVVLITYSITLVAETENVAGAIVGPSDKPGDVPQDPLPGEPQLSKLQAEGLASNQDKVKLFPTEHGVDGYLIDPDAPIDTKGTGKVDAQCADRATCEVLLKLLEPSGHSPTHPLLARGSGVQEAGVHFRKLGTVTGSIRAHHRGKLHIKLNRNALKHLRKVGTMTVIVRGPIKHPHGKSGRIDTELVLVAR